MVIDFIGRKKKKRRIWKPLVMVAVLGLAGYGYYHYLITTPISNESEAQSFVVEQGWGSTRISHELKDAGLIRSALAFQMFVWRDGIDSKLKDGEYFFDRSQSLMEIARFLFAGAGSTKELTLRFIEGWNNAQIAQYLEDQGVATQAEFFEVVQKKASWWDAYDFLQTKPSDRDLEGYLFPDTYRVFRDASVTGIVRKMLDEFDAKLTPQLRNDIERQGFTVHEVLTLASIIEKEVPHPDDRKKVADIFYKRLDAGIALQADSTVNYATGNSTPRASAADLEIDSAYNTYKHRGLPPGPIANPGLSAIEAAVYPEANPYYYFLTTPDGDVIYNVDFDGHVEDKNKYY